MIQATSKLAAGKVLVMGPDECRRCASALIATGACGL
jgi:hypothetical protein